MSKIDLGAATTFAANLAHAARNQQSIKVGGGKFSPAELGNAANALKAIEPAVEGLAEIARMLLRHPEFQEESSTVNYCANKAHAILTALGGEFDESVEGAPAEQERMRPY